MKDTSCSGNVCRPWALIAVMPQHKPKAIGRFANRSDAEAMLRFLQRKAPVGQYYVIFDPGDFESGRDDCERLERQASINHPVPNLHHH